MQHHSHHTAVLDQLASRLILVASNPPSWALRRSRRSIIRVPDGAIFRLGKESVPKGRARRWAIAPPPGW